MLKYKIATNLLMRTGAGDLVTGNGSSELLTAVGVGLAGGLVIGGFCLGGAYLYGRFNTSGSRVGSNGTTDPIFNHYYELHAMAQQAAPTIPPQAHLPSHSRTGGTSML